VGVAGTANVMLTNFSAIRRCGLVTYGLFGMPCHPLIHAIVYGCRFGALTRHRSTQILQENKSLAGGMNRSPCLSPSFDGWQSTTREEPRLGDDSSTNALIRRYRQRQRP